jgi:hypothetical protein
MYSNADYMDAMADRLADINDAIRESDQDEWDGVEEISVEERNACDLYNERNVYPYYD